MPLTANKISYSSSSTTLKNATANALAVAVITRLSHWCYQLFWLTIACVVGCCGDLENLDGNQQALNDVRQKLTSSSTHKRTKSLHDIEMQLIRHLTSPQTSILRPPSPPSIRKRQLSRPPSPQLFDICEADETVCDAA